MRQALLPAAIAALLLALPDAAGAQSASTTSSSAASASQIARPLSPVRPRATPAGTGGQQPQQADVEKQMRDLILRQGRMQMNALVPGSGLALGSDQFEDGLATPPPTIAPPVRADAGKTDAAKSSVRRPPSHVQRFKLGERVSEPLPLRKGGNYGW